MYRYKQAWLTVLLLLASNTLFAEPRAHRYLQTLLAEYRLFELVHDKNFSRALATVFGAPVDSIVLPQSPQQLLQDLMDNPVYSAYATTYAIMKDNYLKLHEYLAKEFDQLRGLPIESFANLGEISLEYLPVVMALDHDAELTELVSMIRRAERPSLSYTLSFSSIEEALYDVAETYPLYIEQAVYTHVGAYLLRETRIAHYPLSPDMIDTLQRLGWSSAQIAMMPHIFAEQAIAEALTPELLAAITVGLDLAIVIDLTMECDVFGAIFLSLAQVARLSRGVYPLKELLAQELLLDTRAPDFEQNFSAMVAVLNDPERPVTLAHLSKLLKLDYTLAEINALTHEGREAIILSNAIDKEDFEEQFAVTSIEDINAIAARSGMLSFHLHSVGIVDIMPHSLDLIPITSQTVMAGKH